MHTMLRSFAICLPVFLKQYCIFFFCFKGKKTCIWGVEQVLNNYYTCYMFYPIIRKLFWDGSVMSYTLAMLPMWCGLILSTDDTIAIRFACNPFDIIRTQMRQTVIMNYHGCIILLIKSIGSRSLSYIGLFYYLVSETI